MGLSSLASAYYNYVFSFRMITFSVVVLPLYFFVSSRLFGMSFSCKKVSAAAFALLQCRARPPCTDCRTRTYTQTTSWLYELTPCAPTLTHSLTRCSPHHARRLHKHFPLLSLVGQPTGRRSLLQGAPGLPQGEEGCVGRWCVSGRASTARRTRRGCQRPAAAGGEWQEGRR